MYRVAGLICAFAFAFAAVSGQSICPGNVEFWPHENCSKYYICNNGNPLEGECPGELLWNSEIDACDFAINVPECVGGTRPPTTVPSTAAPTTTVPSTAAPTTTVPSTAAPTTTVPSTAAPTTTVPSTAAPTTQPPTTGGPTNETPETEGTGSPVTQTTTGLPPGQCPPTGVIKIPHEEQCELYYLCVDGIRQSEVFKCADGLWFDPVIRECNQQSNVDCTPVTTQPPTTTTRPNIPECPDSGIVQLPYPGNCTLYILCIEGVPILYRCPEGFLFDWENAQCEPEGIAVCLPENPFHFRHQQDKNINRPRPQVTGQIKSVSYWNYLKNYVDSSFKKVGLSK